MGVTPGQCGGPGLAIHIEFPYECVSFVIQIRRAAWRHEKRTTCLHLLPVCAILARPCPSGSSGDPILTDYRLKYGYKHNVRRIFISPQALPKISVILGEETMCLHLLPVCGILARLFPMLLGRSYADYWRKLGDKRNVRRRRQRVCTYIRFLLYWIVFVLSSMESPWLTLA